MHSDSQAICLNADYRVSCCSPMPVATALRDRVGGKDRYESNGEVGQNFLIVCPANGPGNYLLLALHGA